MSIAVQALQGRRVGLGTYLLLFLAACAVGLYVIDPWPVGKVGFDAAASVLYFDRLIEGRHLEAFVTATPKPFLTLVYGPIYNLTGDWWPISVLAVATFAMSAVLAAILVGRIGGLSAGVFAGVSVICSPGLIADVGFSYAVVWAFVGCLLAGLAITAERPHYGWAGLALGAAALARFEVFLVLGASAIVLIGAVLWGRYRRVPGPPARAWLVLIGFIALPIQLAHDWLLTGNVFYTEWVPAEASLRLPLIGPIRAIEYIAHPLVAMGPLVALGTVGALVLFRRRMWGILLGLAVMGPGVAAFLVFLSFRRIYISSRYLDPIELAVIVAAAIGFGAIAIPDVTAAARRITAPAARGLLGALGAGVVAALFAAPFAIIDRAAVQTVTDNRAIQLDAREVMPSLRTAIAAIPGATDWPGPTDGQPPTLVVPPLLRPQFAVELGLPLSQVSGVPVTALVNGVTHPVAGQVIYHERGNDPSGATYLEVSRPTTIDGVVVVPLFTDAARGVWVDRIDAAP